MKRVTKLTAFLLALILVFGCSMSAFASGEVEPTEPPTEATIEATEPPAETETEPEEAAETVAQTQPETVTEPAETVAQTEPEEPAETVAQTEPETVTEPETEATFFEELMAAESCKAVYSLIENNVEKCYELTSDELAQLEEKVSAMEDDGYKPDVRNSIAYLQEILEGDGTSVSPYAATLGAGATVYLNEISPAYSKYIKDNGDGTYDLTLDVTGATGTEEDPALVDILFVLDLSGSMNWEMGSKNTASKGESRLDKAETAISSLIETLGATSGIDAQYKLLTFANSATVKTDWVQGSDLTSALDSLNASGGTNYQAALVLAGSEITSARNDAVRLIFFLTDGIPGCCKVTKVTKNDTYSFQLGQPENKQDGTDKSGYYLLDNNGEDFSFTSYYATDAQKYGCWYGSVMGASAVACDYFYAVGFSTEMNTTPSSTNTKVIEIYNNQTPLQLLQAVAGATTAGTKEAVVTQDLTTYFSDFAATITDITVSDVTITDTLSQYAQATANSKLVITATDENGKSTTGTGTISAGATLTIDDSVTITASYDQTSKKVTLDFPNDYTLVDHWTYSVTLTIEPTDAAYTYYAQNGYPNTGDDGTDATGNTTSSNQLGFHSNKEATLSYKVMTGETADNGHTQTYDHPVIQVKTTTVTITKQVTGNMGDTSKAFSFTVTCGSAMGAATDKEYELSDDGKIATFSLSDGQSVTLNGVKKGSTLTISEESGGYTMTVQVGETALDKVEGKYSYTVPQDGSDLQITVTNEKEVTIDTGVVLDAVPYIWILAVAAAGAVLLTVRRKTGEK